MVNSVRIIPLGGVEEIGKNMMLIECGNDIIVVDCGMAFPDEEMLGIDLVIPDATYFFQNIDRVRGIILTHGHEDHIGAIPYLLREYKVPVYGTKFTLGLVEAKLQEHSMDVDTVEISAGETITLGCFDIEFIMTAHSIPGSVALAVRTPIGTIVHTSDFKIDLTPVQGNGTDLARFAQLGAEGVLLLMADSTNIERPGYTMSEKRISQTLEEIFSEAQGRIIISTFSSNVYRIQQIVNQAQRQNRKVCFIGRSMVRVVNVAKELGELSIADNVIIDISELGKVTDDKLVIITTGSQGEPMSGLVRMASHEHPYVVINEGDTVIISANPIPGNEKFVSRVVNQLYRCGANVIYSALADVHVSGHACQEELKIIQSLIRPKYFIPVHGEYRHLVQHAKLARDMGLDKENVVIPENGKVIEITQEEITASENVAVGNVLVDGLGIGDVGNVVLRDRKHLSQDGLMVVVVTVSSEDGTLLAGPDIISRGFVYVRESEQLMDEARELVLDVISQMQASKHSQLSTLKSNIKGELRKYLYQKTMRSPMILPVIVEM